MFLRKILNFFKMKTTRTTTEATTMPPTTTPKPTPKPVVNGGETAIETPDSTDFVVTTTTMEFTDVTLPPTDVTTPFSTPDVTPAPQDYVVTIVNDFTVFEMEYRDFLGGKVVAKVPTGKTMWRTSDPKSFVPTSKNPEYAFVSTDGLCLCVIYSGTCPPQEAPVLIVEDGRVSIPKEIFEGSTDFVKVVYK